MRLASWGPTVYIAANPADRLSGRAQLQAPRVSRKKHVSPFSSILTTTSIPFSWTSSQPPFFPPLFSSTQNGKKGAPVPQLKSLYFCSHCCLASRNWHIPIPFGIPATSSLNLIPTRLQPLSLEFNPQGFSFLADYAPSFFVPRLRVTYHCRLLLTHLAPCFPPQAYPPKPLQGFHSTTFPSHSHWHQWIPPTPLNFISQSPLYPFQLPYHFFFLIPAWDAHIPPCPGTPPPNFFPPFPQIFAVLLSVLKHPFLFPDTLRATQIICTGVRYPRLCQPRYCPKPPPLCPLGSTLTRCCKHLPNGVSLTKSRFRYMSDSFSTPFFPAPQHPQSPLSIELLPMALSMPLCECFRVNLLQCRPWLSIVNAFLTPPPPPHHVWFPSCRFFQLFPPAPSMRTHIGWPFLAPLNWCQFYCCDPALLTHIK